MVALLTLLAAVFESAPATLPSVARDVPPLEAPVLTAQGAFLIDTRNGDILLSDDADLVHPLASITKLMTAVVLLDTNPKWSEYVLFEKRDERKGDIPYLIVGEELTIGDVWNLMLIASSNDATALLVRTLVGQEQVFVERMNEKARVIGLKHTRFADPTGLSVDNVSTAREIAALTRIAMSYPKIADSLARSHYIITPRGRLAREIKSTNQLLHWFRPAGTTIFGGKTGHIVESGYNFAFIASRAGHELVGVIVGAKNNDARFSEMSKLMQWGLKNAK